MLLKMLANGSHQLILTILCILEWSFLSIIITIDGQQFQIIQYYSIRKQQVTIWFLDQTGSNLYNSHHILKYTCPNRKQLTCQLIYSFKNLLHKFQVILLVLYQLMTTTGNEENKLQPQPFKLNYDPSEIQGQCLLESVVPVYRSTPMFALYIFLSIIFVGIPLLLTYWYPWLKRTIYFRPCSLNEATYFHVINYDGVSTYPQKQTRLFYYTSTVSNNVICFVNRYLLYLVENQTVKAASFKFIDRVNEVMSSQNAQKKSYFSQKDVPNLLNSYGPGAMKIQLPSIPMLFFVQVMRPLYLFILFSCSLWIYQKYYYYSGVIFVTAAIGIITNLVQTYYNNKKIHEMAYHEEIISALRGGQAVEISSTQLVPGDIVFLKKQIKIPFDGIILQGDALINECALTGESVPILKKPEKITTKADIKSSYIYQGTNLIQVGNKKKMVKFEHFREKYGVPVLICRTNFATMKGQLIRVISFPRERQNIFERQSTKFLIFLFCLSVISYGILLAKLTKYVSDGNTLFVKFLDLITITVPPGLPVSMTFGIIFALEKMKAKKIFCSSPNKVIHGGLTNWLCFDKTGTLTQDFMDFDCMVLNDKTKFTQPVYNRGQKLQETNLQALVSSRQNALNALNNMAMNHTIVNVQQTGQNVGDPMEIKLFEFGHFKFSNEQNDSSQIIMSFTSDRGHKGFVYKRFDFDSQLFRMSAIGKSSVTGDDFYLYIKGSPQMMMDMGVFKRQTIPSDYLQVLKSYASQGFRVLAIGSKKIDKGSLSNDRIHLQTDINFDGFQVFQNRLKPQTRGAIQQLVNAQLPCVMITGDNALTGSNMACQCEISDPSKKTLIINYNPQQHALSFEQFIYKANKPELETNTKHRKTTPLWEQYSHEQPISSDAKIANTNFGSIQLGLPKTNEVNQDQDLIISKLNDPNVQLCITGPALNRIFTGQQKNLTQKQKFILMRTTVFARAKPNDKIKAISLYQKFGKKVSMCGDGANDCGALKQADIGLSLSMAEASISAPFTSQITNISSMVQLLKECRAGLATNFSLFNIMALYSLIQYTSTIITQYYFSYPGDLHYLYWDIFCNFLFFLTIGYTGTAERLSVQIPNGSLFTVSNLTQVLTAFVLQLVGQILMIVGLTQIFAAQLQYDPQATYNQFLADEQAFVLDSPQNNALFLFSNIMYIATLLAFSISKPWRKHFYTNPLFMLILLLILTYSLVMIVVYGARLDVLTVTSINNGPFQWYIFGLAVGIGVVIYVLQKFVLQPVFNWLKEKYPDRSWL